MLEKSSNHNKNQDKHTKRKQRNQGYRNRYDIIDHEHEKKTFMYFFHRPIFAKIREFATIVLLNGIERFSESTLNSS